MLEFEEIDSEGANCLLTMAEKVVNAANLAPNSWKLQNENYHPLEYLVDTFVLSNGDLIETQKNWNGKCI